MTRIAGTIVATLLAVCVIAAAQDLSGVWTGVFNITVDGETRPDVVHMVLKQSGTSITGTVGPNTENQWPIANGKVDGAKVTFQVQPEGEMALVTFSLTLAEGHLKGEANAQAEGRSFSAAVDVARKVN